MIWHFIKIHAAAGTAVKISPGTISPQQEGEYVHRPLSDEDICVQVSGMWLVADQIYEVVVDCPFCGAQNEFNCKIEQELPGLKSRI